MTTFFSHKIRRVLFAVLTVGLIATAVTACGHHRSHDWGNTLSQEQFMERRDKMVDRAASKLDLNADQKKLLTVVGDKVFEQRQALIGTTKDPRAELQSLIAGPKFDATKAQALINEKSGALQTKSPEVVAALAAFYDSLNPTQQQKVRDLMEGRHGWFQRG